MNKVELTWYEKKQGISLKQKIDRLEKKEKRKQKRQSEKKEDEEVKERSFHTEKKAVNYIKNDSLFDPGKIPEDAKDVINDFSKLLDSSHPLNSRHKAMLPSQIKVLSHFLTDERQDRRLGYMNQTEHLVAYTHYYMWWNLVRLTRLFANLPSSFFNLKDACVCLDIGSGPLTLVAALFLARPELRKKKLTWYCMDISQSALNMGQDIFLSIVARLKCQAWDIIKVKEAFAGEIKQKATFITCANMFNESAQDSSMPPDFIAKKYCQTLLSYADKADKNTRFLLVEPGVPKNARLISLLRDAFMRRGFSPISPCPHTGNCPMTGQKGGKWCNWAFSTEDAPRALLKLSEAAYLPKERAVLSFLALQKTAVGDRAEAEQMAVRVSSEKIRLAGNRSGYYACSDMGLLLLQTDDKLDFGQCIRFSLPKGELSTDRKTGAFIVPIKAFKSGCQ